MQQMGRQEETHLINERFQMCGVERIVEGRRRLPPKDEHTEALALMDEARVADVGTFEQRAQLCVSLERQLRYLGWAACGDLAEELGRVCGAERCPLHILRS